MELEILTGRVATLEKLVIQLAKWVNFDAKQCDLNSGGGTPHQYQGRKAASTVQKSTRRLIGGKTTLPTLFKKARSSNTSTNRQRTEPLIDSHLEDSDIEIKTEETLNSSQDGHGFILGDIPLSEDNDDGGLDLDEFQIQPITSSHDLDSEDGNNPIGTDSDEDYVPETTSTPTKTGRRRPKRSRFEPRLQVQEEYEIMENAVFKVVTSTKGRPMVAMDGMIYTLQKIAPRKRYWICDNYDHSKCLGKLHTTTDLEDLKIISVNGTHNHPQKLDEIEVAEAMTKIREEALTSTASPADIISSIISKSQMSSSSLEKLPQRDGIKRMIRMIRAKHRKNASSSMITSGEASCNSSQNG